MSSESLPPDGDAREAPPPRESGVLLHPTSLPGPHGIGDLGAAAYRWLDFLVAGRQQLWQILPLGPPGFGESPYAARSAFAANPLLISLDALAEDGLLDAARVREAAVAVTPRIDFDAVAERKLPLLDAAFQRFRGEGRADDPAYAAFLDGAREWLDDYALFVALRQQYPGRAWTAWPAPLVRREPEALAEARRRHATAIERERFIQFVARQQWQALHREASARGIRIVGDVPIFVAHDSADVWAHQDLFKLDGDGEPLVVAGVPPDYFSVTGQRWGNPVYRWDRMAARGYRWWVERFRDVLACVDLVRIDHFRGFEAAWEVPATEETAVKGRWVPGPGLPFFEALTVALGPLPVIVEDLGLITRAVDDLRLALGYPGMKVLQFAFGGTAANPYLPHNYERNSVVYTGTHDNDTTEGWFAALPEPERAHVIRYTSDAAEPVSRKLIRLALGSIARSAIVPLQDVLALGSDARMNVPGYGTGNWNWRATAEQIDPAGAGWLAEVTELYGRAPGGLHE